MLSPQQVYSLALAWLQSLGPQHALARQGLAALLAALLVAQSLRPTALMRALPCWGSRHTVPARARYQRVARFWDRPWLEPAELTPRLVRAALALVAPDPPGTPTAGLTHLALDSVRCGSWEVFTLGVVWHGRVLLVGWTVLPYPWPKGAFTPTVCALLRQVAQAWPPDRPAHLVADRGFPSRELFRTLRQVGWGWTVRLRANNWVTVDGQPQAQAVRERLTDGRPGGWRSWLARFGTAQGEAGTLVIGRGLPVVPFHQKGPASLARRAQQWQRRQQHLASKHPGRQPDRSAETDAWVVWFTSHPGWREASWSYRQRWATEGSYRDGQSGWDGQHGWDLEEVVAGQQEPAAVERVVGLWALGLVLQSWVGDQVGQATAPAEVRAVVREWTVTGRLSVWARGRLALREPSGRLAAWLEETLRQGAARLQRGGPPAARPAAEKTLAAEPWQSQPAAA